MSKMRLNIEMPQEEFRYLKSLCARRGESLKDFVLPAIYKRVEEEEDELWASEALKRIKNLKDSDLIPIEEAFENAGWNDEKLQDTNKPAVRKRAKANRSAAKTGYKISRDVSRKKSTSTRNH